MKAIFGIWTALRLTPVLASARDRAFQPAALSAQPAVGTEWLREAKFGMFIHRGLFPSSAGF